MVNDLCWLVAGRILFVKYSGLVTFDEVQGSVKQLVQMAKDEGKSPFVHLIGDSSEIEEFDTRLKNIRNLLATFALIQRKPFIGWAVSASGTTGTRFPTVQFVTLTAAKTLGIHFYPTRSLEEALDFLQNVDATLPPNLIEELIPPSETKTAHC